MIIVTKRPERNHADNNSIECKWNCARQPILFELHRQDLQLISVNAGLPGTTVLKTVYDPAIVGGISVGDYLYFESSIDPVTNVAGHYGVKARVTYIASGAPNYYHIYVDYTAEVPSTNGGYINILTRENYYSVVTVYITDKTTDVVHPVLVKLKPGVDGRMRLDTSEFITAYLSKTLRSISAINERDNTAFGDYYLTYSERWAGSSNTEVIDGGGTYYFVDAAKKLLSMYGQNMMDYLTIDTDIPHYAKFLTDFDSPTYWVGYPFDLSFIYGESLSGIAITREVEQFQSGGVAGTVLSSSIQQGRNVGTVNRICMPSLTSGTKYVDFYLKANSIPQVSYYENYYHASGYHETQPPSPASLSPYRMTEKKRIKIEESCGRNPVYLRWRNSKGGWDAWLFEGNQTINFDTKQGQEFEQEPDEISTGVSRSITIDSAQLEKVTCGSIVLKEDVAGIAGIEASPAVYMLVGTSPDQWLRVKITPRGFSYQTKGATAEVQVQFVKYDHYTIPN